MRQTDTDGSVLGLQMSAVQVLTLDPRRATNRIVSDVATKVFTLSRVAGS